jgi:uncharacterized protein with WD repeat
MTTSTVHFYNGRDVGGKEEFNLVVKNVFQFSLTCGIAKSKEKEYRVATFVPEKNNTMADVSVWRIFERSGSKPQEMPKKEVTKVFGRGQKVDFLWNSAASALVVKVRVRGSCVHSVLTAWPRPFRRWTRAGARTTARTTATTCGWTARWT